MLKIAHISDPHFSTITAHWRQFLTKRWLGNLNLLLFRRPFYATWHLEEIPSVIEKEGASLALITGDYSSLSFDDEFELGKAFAASLGVPTLSVPGNHDVYTKECERIQRYYNHFPSEEMATHRVAKKQLDDHWWWVGLDCARANDLLHSNGVFYPKMDEKLEETLQEIPHGDRVIICNHFPLYGHNRPKHDLERLDVLQAICKKYPQVKLYLHGHDHFPYIKDRTDEGYPLVLNAGSCAKFRKGTFYILELEDDRCRLKRYSYQKGWIIDKEGNYTF